ncbi:hypothetical protein HPB49_009805 [Dermacentor silvarum]|uniref:Uncharacterized protein n=1 Tax=Dermacentor silvarum TaxID=543639 RepID=A0ACB8DP08_DERSI|nr:hypothetical protein HPB49_009805 [Dermacentor silvarum]
MNRQDARNPLIPDFYRWVDFSPFSEVLFSDHASERANPNGLSLLSARRRRGRSRSRRRSKSRKGESADASRSRSRSRSQSAKHTMWADKVKGVTQPSQKGKKNTSNKGTKGEAQPEHRVDPRIQSLEAENRQLRRKLAELEEALNSIRGQVTNREEASTNNPGPLAGQPKRKAPNPDPLSDTEDEEEMTEDCETPSTTLAPPAQNEGLAVQRADKLESKVADQTVRAIVVQLGENALLGVVAGLAEAGGCAAGQCLHLIETHGLGWLVEVAVLVARGPARLALGVARAGVLEGGTKRDGCLGDLRVDRAVHSKTNLPLSERSVSSWLMAILETLTGTSFFTVLRVERSMKFSRRRPLTFQVIVA